MGKWARRGVVVGPERPLSVSTVDRVVEHGGDGGTTFGPMALKSKTE